MKHKTPSVPCPKCGGVGTVGLPRGLSEALYEVRQTPGLTIPELLDRFAGIGQAAVNKRLVELERLNLVTRTRQGHAWRWYPAK